MILRFFQRRSRPALCGLPQRVSPPCRQWPRMSGTAFRCEMIKISFHSSLRFSRRKERSLHISPRFSCSWLSCGWWKARRRDRADPKRTKRRNKGRQSKFHPEYLRVTFTAAFPVGVPKSPRAVREHPRLQKVLRRKRKGRKVWKRKKTRKSSRRAVKINSDLPIAMLRCWPEFLSTIMSIFRHFQNFWWRSELSHLGHHVSTKWCPFRSSRFLSRQLLIAVKAVFSCIMHSSVNEIYLLISRKQPSFNTWFYNLTLQKTPTAMNKYRHCSLAIGIVSFWRMGLTLPMFSDRAMDVEVDWKSIKASTRREGIWEASTAKWRLGTQYTWSVLGE